MSKKRKSSNKAEMLNLITAIIELVTSILLLIIALKSG